MFVPNREELAWAAGFFDGEGHVAARLPGVGTRRRFPELLITISQIDQRVLGKFRDAVGMGRVRGPYGPYKNGKSQIWVFGLTGFEMVQAAIAMLWPWLGPVKREQAKAALLACRGHVRTERSPYQLTCMRGHPLDDAYVYVYNGRPTRKCRACHELRYRERVAKANVGSTPLLA